MNPFASIWEDRPEAPKKTVAAKVKPKRDHSEARGIYESYLRKKEELFALREYAKSVVKATEGNGMTLVRPLATMNRGGALLCDYCNRPMILEGGRYNKVFVDIAWKSNPEPHWRSYIKGGMVVEIVENGTLRVYHGYMTIADACCSTAKRERDAAILGYRIDQRRLNLLGQFVADEFNGDNALLTDLVEVMLSYDPGLGVNRP